MGLLETGAISNGVWIQSHIPVFIFYKLNVCNRKSVKSQLIGKDLDAGKDWRQEDKGTTEDEMLGGHHQLNGYEFEQTPGGGEGQGSLACCSQWGHKELDMT